MDYGINIQVEASGHCAQVRGKGELTLTSILLRLAGSMMADIE
jgi:hypothetical protein